ncbi:MAG: (deoxy)nucleoside triphosphate pyrophosphohydrolase [Desulfobacterales bacterium]|nr:(deoxy)nucleoside triphosphate pyrophosphohydrolase [Desulfobacterales bacterium]
MKRAFQVDITAALIVKKGKILLARRRPGIAHAGAWEYPGGKPLPDETAEDAIVREIREELGIVCRVVGFVGEGRGQNGEKPIRLLGFEMTWESGEIVPSDHDLIHWVAPENLLDYTLLPPDIPIAKTFIAKHSL